LGTLPPHFAGTFGGFMTQQGIKSIPVDLIDAARMDGAGEVRIVLTIIAPLKDSYGNIDYGPSMAATKLSTVPARVVHLLSEKFIVRGIALTGFKD
jgi:ABC-type glycerol-3-phosphate transport system permease component